MDEYNSNPTTDQTFFVLLSARRPLYPPLLGLTSATGTADVALGSAVDDSIDAVPATIAGSSGTGDWNGELTKLDCVTLHLGLDAMVVFKMGLERAARWVSDNTGISPRTHPCGRSCRSRAGSI